MALDFPSNPTNGQIYGDYFYDSSIGAWLAQGSTNNVGTQIAGLQAKFPVSVANGGTGATTVAGARTALGLGGTVLQVVHNSYATQVDNHTSSPVDTGLTATITPTSASSKILVMVTQAGVHKVGSSNIYSSVGLALLRGTTNLTTFEIQMGQTGSSMEINLGTASTVWLDSPATTSAITYKTTFYNNINTSRVTVQYASSRSSIVLMEVAG